jgi:hypothetical protein
MFCVGHDQMAVSSMSWFVRMPPRVVIWRFYSGRVQMVASGMNGLVFMLLEVVI